MVIRQSPDNKRVVLGFGDTSILVEEGSLYGLDVFSCYELPSSLDIKAEKIDGSIETIASVVKLHVEESRLWELW